MSMKRTHSIFTRARVPLVIIAAAGAILFGLAGAAPLVAQQTQAAGTAAPKVEGGWLRTDPTGSGAYEGLTVGFEKAALTPEAAATLAARGGNAIADVGTGAPAQPVVRGEFDPSNKTLHPVGVAYLAGSQFPCRFGGGGSGGLEYNSAAFFLVADKDQVAIVREGPGARVIYLDGRKHPDSSNWTPNGSGHSVGHYENGVLVIDTVGMATGPVTAGGWRTPETHLTERYIPSADGEHLTITYTWDDPKIYQKPHTYQYTFDRLPKDSYALEGWCDASDPKERQSIVPPEQK